MTLEKKTFFNNDEFDLVISINTLHNLKIFDLFKTLKEIRRISKKSYIVVESYTNEYELFKSSVLGFNMPILFFN